MKAAFREGRQEPPAKALRRRRSGVILDVCYSHTAEGNHLGPTLSLRGIDNRTYYRLIDDDLRHYVDTSAHGNVPSRGPYASINFVCIHDGFTLHDLVSYDEKHNEANGENNEDGPKHLYSWNCGAEGSTDDPSILALRERQKRNFIATLLVAQGVPMLQMGDEMGRTQQGNNNAYCHDSELT